MAIEVDEARFRELVAEAIDAIPEGLARYMENVAVFVEDWATADQQRAHRGTLLGLYEGVSLTRRSPLSYNGALPDRITIFRVPHCRLARTEDDLRARVKVTVVHEIAHHFGLDDRRLHELGWY